MYKLPPELRPASTSRTPWHGERLEAIRKLIPPKSSHVDVATGHGKLLAALAIHNHDRRLVGTDRSPEEIVAARRIVCERLGESPATLSFEVRTDIPPGDSYDPSTSWSLSISGLGGKSIAALLNQHRRELRQYSSIVIQPNRDAGHVRYAMHRAGFAPQQEFLVKDRDYLYTLQQFRRWAPSNPPVTFYEQHVGRFSPTHNSDKELLRFYCQCHIEHLSQKLQGAMHAHDWEAIQSFNRTRIWFDQIRKQHA